jgi:PadR family transcriptional regulator PadR
MEKSSLDVVRGTLDVLILKTLSWGAMHGYAISQAILRQTDEALLVEEGALYPALYRMESKGWLEAEWGVSENNRRAKYYRLTVEGRRRLREEMKTWGHYAEAVGKVLGATSKPQWEKA